MKEGAISAELLFFNAVLYFGLVLFYNRTYEGMQFKNMGLCKKLQAPEMSGFVAEEVGDK